MLDDCDFTLAYDTTSNGVSFRDSEDVMLVSGMSCLSLRNFLFRHASFYCREIFAVEITHDQPDIAAYVYYTSTASAIKSNIHYHKIKDPTCIRALCEIRTILHDTYDRNVLKEMRDSLADILSVIE